jgi:hypothetical protein
MENFNNFPLAVFLEIGGKIPNNWSTCSLKITIQIPKSHRKVD